MKKKLFLGLLPLMALALTACGGGSGSSQAPSSAQPQPSSSEPAPSSEPASQPAESSEPASQPAQSSEPASQPEVSSEPESQPEVSSEPESEPEVSSEPESEPEESSEEPIDLEPTNHKLNLGDDVYDIYKVVGYDGLDIWGGVNKFVTDEIDVTAGQSIAVNIDGVGEIWRDGHDQENNVNGAALGEFTIAANAEDIRVTIYEYDDGGWAYHVPGEAGGESGEETDSQYYLVGKLKGVDCWSAEAGIGLVANTEAEGEYMLAEAVELYANDGIKVLDGENNTWYPDGMGNEYKLTEGGEYQIYFRPDGQGGDGWYEGFFMVEKVGEGSGEQGGDSQEQGDVGYYLVGKLNGVDSWTAEAGVALIANTEAEGEYFLENPISLSAGDGVKVVSSNNEWYPEGMATEWNITEDGNYQIYFRPAGNSEWANGFFFITTAEAGGEESQEETSQEEQQLEGYFVVGKLNGVDSWSAETGVALIANTEAEGEYFLENPISLKAGDGIKVLSGETYYPEGMGTEWNITADGNYQIYFRPAGNSEWANGFFFVAPVE